MDSIFHAYNKSLVDHKTLPINNTQTTKMSDSLTDSGSTNPIFSQNGIMDPFEGIPNNVHTPQDIKEPQENPFNDSTSSHSSSLPPSSLPSSIIPPSSLHPSTIPPSSSKDELKQINSSINNNGPSIDHASQQPNNMKNPSSSHPTPLSNSPSQPIHSPPQGNYPPSFPSQPTNPPSFFSPHQINSQNSMFPPTSSSSLSGSPQLHHPPPSSFNHQDFQSPSPSSLSSLPPASSSTASQNKSSFQLSSNSSFQPLTSNSIRGQNHHQQQQQNIKQQYQEHQQQQFHHQQHFKQPSQPPPPSSIHPTQPLANSFPPSFNSRQPIIRHHPPYQPPPSLNHHPQHQPPHQPQPQLPPPHQSQPQLPPPHHLPPPSATVSAEPINSYMPSQTASRPPPPQQQQQLPPLSNHHQPSLPQHRPIQPFPQQPLPPYQSQQQPPQKPSTNFPQWQRPPGYLPPQQQPPTQFPPQQKPPTQFPPQQQPPQFPPQQQLPQFPPQQQPPVYPQQFPPQQQQPPAYPQQFPPPQQPPQWPQQPQYANQNQQLSNQFGSLNVNQDANLRACSLLNEALTLPEGGFEVFEPLLHANNKKPNCHPDLMSSTLNTVPKNNSLLQKTRLPFGLLMHPFKDLPQLPLIQATTIARCSRCRTYINPFVTFVDPTNWKCNVCSKNNEVPQDFNYDPVNRTYGDPHFRPEIQSATVEYVAPSEYLVRPPPPATYLYLLDVSFNAIETGYLEVFCEQLLQHIDSIPGDGRKRLGFIAVDTACHFFNLSPDLSQPQVFCVPDLEDMSAPLPDNLLANLKDSRESICNLLRLLPSIFKNTERTQCALGSALEVASKLLSSSGGRLTVFQTHLPTIGAGALKNREESAVNKSPHLLSAVTDFYKTLALDSSANQLAIDVFFLNSQFVDVATIAGVSKYTGGSMYYFPGFHSRHNPVEVVRFQSVLKRYLTRKIGFEAVMRVRCSRGIGISHFHGNCFVRSTDLLSLPNINPDAGFALQLSIEDALECNYVALQAAVLYTSSKGDRRIRVHTLCLPVSSVISDIHANANQVVIIGLLSKMAVDRSIASGLSDSKEAIVNAAVDMLQAYHNSLPPGQRAPNHLLSPPSLQYIPLLTLALLKHTTFKSTGRLDDRVVGMEMMKNLPLSHLILSIYPSLYPIHNLDIQTMYTNKPNSPTPPDDDDDDGDENNDNNEDNKQVILPPLACLSNTQLDRHGAYIMDCGDYLYLYLGSGNSDTFCGNLLGVASFASTTEGLIELPDLDTELSQYVRAVVRCLNEDRPYTVPLILIREDGKLRGLFHERFVEDKTDSSYSYQEYLQHIHKEIKN